MTAADAMYQPIPPLPEFEVELAPPALGAWRTGNTGVPGFWSFTAPAPGPHVALVCLLHGNEFAGAIVVAGLLAERLRPLRGRLTLGFANLAAFDRFDRAQPTASRFVEEDLNRIWDRDLLDGPRRSVELSRAREMRPIIESVDALLDLHSMLWPSDPLLLCGATDKGRAMAEAIATPPLVIADEGHASGRRLIDYGAFADPAAGPTAVLVEAGPHWARPTVAQTRASALAMLRIHGLIDSARNGARAEPRPQPRFARVTQVATAITAGFEFVRPFRGGEVVREAGTLIATDGTVELRTPHDDCILVMPSLRTSRGHTAVRLARYEA